MKQSFMVLCVLVLLIANTAFAHHPSHVSSSGNTMSFNNGEVSKPRSEAYLSSELSHLDDSVGQLYTFNVGGEYAFNTRLSAGANLALLHVAHNFRPTQTGIGDIYINAKYLFWQSEKSFAYVATALGLPTGSSSDGLGRGALSQQTSLSFATMYKEWLFYTLMALDLGYESDPTPLLVNTLGIVSPTFLKRLKAALVFTNQAYLASDVFTDGSGKLFIEPQLFINLTKQWLLTVSGRMSAYDYLQRSTATTLTNTDNALLGDIFISGKIGISYKFKN
jgi:hypothetical protein